MRRESERGATLIIVGLTIVVLMAMSTFVIDMGVLWVARRQAQNTADAAALSGVIAYAFDDSVDLTNSGLAHQSADAVARLSSNQVFGQTAAITVYQDPANWDPAVPAPLICGSPLKPGCVQVDIYRDTAHNNPLPVFFATLLGQSNQNIRATATAIAAVANGSNCMRPWFIPDRYVDADHSNSFTPGDTLLPYKIPDDIGDVVSFHDNLGPSYFGQLDVGSGASAIGDAITHCVTNTQFFVGQQVSTDPGNKLGPERAGIQTLISYDPDYDPLSNPGGVRWDATKKAVVGGCAPAGTCQCPTTAAQCPYAGTLSPRIVQAAVCDPSAEPTCDAQVPGKNLITITNILSFFITGYQTSAGHLVIDAVLMGSKGIVGPGPVPSTSFVKVIELVR